MSRNGSGIYSLATGNPVVTGTTVSSTWANSTLTDIASALTTSIASDGQTVISANIPMNSKKLTGLAAPTVAGDALSFGAVATLTDLTTTGNTILGNASTDTLNVGNGDLVKDASGNVGIGTASPTTKLHVATGANTGLLISSTNGTTFQGIAFNSNNDQFTIGTLTAHPTVFYANNAERMRIDSSGNVMVGTTSSSNKFTVVSNSSTLTPVFINDTATGSTSQFLQYFIRNGSNVGSIQTTGTATSYVTSSDYRLKEDVAPMVGALDTVSALKPVTYKWKSDGSDGQGFIAHELQTVIPDCVTGQKDAVETYTDEDGVEQTRPVYQGIDTSFLVATLTSAIQELKAIIDTQQTQITALNAKVGI